MIIEMLLWKFTPLSFRDGSSSVIPARFWPESRDAMAWIPARGMPE
jgi:hypothetical protein